MIKGKLIRTLTLMVILMVLFLQCRDRSKRIAVKIVTVKNGIENEEISYLDKRHLEFEILPSGEEESFAVIQQIQGMTWKDGEPNLKLVCVIDDSTSNRVKVNQFTKAKEFKNKKEFLDFMTSKDYVLIKENSTNERLSFERQ